MTPEELNFREVLQARTGRKISSQLLRRLFRHGVRSVPKFLSTSIAEICRYHGIGDYLIEEAILLKRLAAGENPRFMPDHIELVGPGLKFPVSSVSCNKRLKKRTIQLTEEVDGCWSITYSQNLVFSFDSVQAIKLVRK